MNNPLGIRYSWVLGLLVVVLLAGCNGTATTTNEPPLTTGVLQPATGRDLRIVTGQTVYVPAYSEVFTRRSTPNMELAVTLAVHNTDFNTPIIIRAVRYYDTDGNMIRNYIDEPVAVGPLATTGFLVEDSDRSGGWGSNFVVEWVAEAPVYEPVIEAIMISTRGTQGVSMISLGRVISQTRPDEIPDFETPAEGEREE